MLVYVAVDCDVLCDIILDYGIVEFSIFSYTIM